ncbi:hypothetical protein BBAD15_g7873 [Beauveria bassiana D1-5]|uniref:Uncharacterized protein n=2 Tax=Beauveria bassiana TaxID=176275 RepID=A0A0A2VG08_BEABA|nr:hypothetical protein BBAD15_g7873 [Beauveria bassiana D1-5]
MSNVLNVLQFLGLAGSFYVNYLILVFYRSVALVRLYGLRGLLYYCFGSQVTWRIQTKVLGTLQYDDASPLQKAAIVAQIVITGPGFAELSSTHWFARALSLFSVLASLMAVYYATAQHRIMGRLHQPAQVCGWILGRMPLDGELLGTRRQDDPQHHDLMRQRICNSVRELTQKYLYPSITSVLTVSTPQMFLSSSLLSLLLGVGVYFGFVWTRAVDNDAGYGDSRNILIVYLVSVMACFRVYSVSQLLQMTSGNWN